MRHEISTLKDHDKFFPNLLVLKFWLVLEKSCKQMETFHTFPIITEYLDARSSFNVSRYSVWISLSSKIQKTMTCFSDYLIYSPWSLNVFHVYIFLLLSSSTNLKSFTKVFLVFEAKKCFRHIWNILYWFYLTDGNVAILMILGLLYLIWRDDRKILGDKLLETTVSS